MRIYIAFINMEHLDCGYELDGVYNTIDEAKEHKGSDYIVEWCMVTNSRLTTFYYYRGKWQTSTCNKIC